MVRRVAGPVVTVGAAVAAAAVVTLPWWHHVPTSARTQVPPVVTPGDADPAPAAQVPTRLLPPARGVYFGVFNTRLAKDPSGLASWADAHGPRPRIVHRFQQWGGGDAAFRADWAGGVADAGAVPMISWEPWRTDPHARRQRLNQPAYAPRRIAAGVYDAYVRRWARDAAAYRRPVLVRLMHEMNGNWYPWAARAHGNTPREYVAAWRHVVGIFRREGATNVSWVWNINNLEGAAVASERLADYYPGGRWVDWVGTSGFNWGGNYVWSGWRSADDILAGTYARLARFGKPVMFSEVGTVDGDGRSAMWTKDALRTFRAHYPRLRAVVWYDAVDAGGNDFRLPPAQRLSHGAADGWFQPLHPAPAGP